MLAINDYEGYTEDEVKEDIINNYSGGEIEEISKEDIIKKLQNLDILIASLEDFGCEESSLFLFKSKISSNFYFMQGSHCSCYGFEGQFYLEEIDLNVLTGFMIIKSNKQLLNFVKSLIVELND